MCLKRFDEGNDVLMDSGEGGLFSELPSDLATGPARIMLPWGEGASLPGAFATTPTDNAYQFVLQAQVPLQASGGNVGALMAGSKWSSLDTSSARTIVTYSFADPQTSTFAYSDGGFQATLSPFSATDRQVLRDVLSRIEAVANVEFVEVADNAGECGVLRYGYSQQPNALGYAGYSFFPAASAIGGDIWIGANQAKPQWDFYRADLFLHETLHAIGLKHPFDSGAVLSNDQNIIPNTVMSYSTLPGGSSGYMSHYPVEPMALDIAALQYLYGASNLNAGDTVYDLAGAQLQAGFHALWDAGGSDTFDASRVGRAVTLDLNEGARSNVGASVTASANVGGGTASATYTSTVSIAGGAVIENAVGSAYNDALIGNGVANALRGGAGADRLEGRGGNDVLTGGAGDDALDGGAGLDTAVYEGARGAFAIGRSGGGFTVSGAASGSDSLANVERLEFANMRVALDLDGNAGTVAKLLGAVFGAAAVHNAEYVGIGLGLLDGGMSGQDLAQLAIDARLGGHAGNAAVVDLLYTNVAGSAPSAGERALYVGMLDRGDITQGALGQLAADTMANQLHIDLVGLAATGLEYI